MACDIYTVIYTRDKAHSDAVMCLFLCFFIFCSLSSVTRWFRVHKPPWKYWRFLPVNSNKILCQENSASLQYVSLHCMHLLAHHTSTWLRDVSKAHILRDRETCPKHIHRPRDVSKAHIPQDCVTCPKYYTVGLRDMSKAHITHTL